MSKSDVGKNILTIQTVQIAPFRTLMTALKDILLETNIIFSKEGIKTIFTHISRTKPKMFIATNSRIG